MTCRHCGAPLRDVFLDLGTAPPSNAYLDAAALRAPEVWYPLRVLVCRACWLVQTEDVLDRDQLFTADYAYFSSVSSTWVEHARRYVGAMIERFSLGPESHVVEIAANDGYLLRHVREAGIPCLGVEPTAAAAGLARDRGIPVVEAYFGRDLADRLRAEGRAADLMVANNVLAHVPDINDFAAGFTRLLKPAGVATFEFPHLARLIAETQFDTVYHEHYSYLSLHAVDRVFRAAGLSIFDVEALPTHGGSLRLFAQRADTGARQRSDRVAKVLQAERSADLGTLAGYRTLQPAAERIRNALLRYLLDCRDQGLTVAAYGAAAKGNTLLNFAGVRSDLLPYVVDRNPAKQGRFLPGSRIPIVDEARLEADRPDRILILPWNLRDEIARQLAGVLPADGRFVTAVPELREFR